jgi:hypothetical protein
VFILPDAAWARRVSGVFANDLASAYPAPRPRHADACAERALCGQRARAVDATRPAPMNSANSFETGGGRKAAAGINVLPEARIPDFVAAFFATWPA